jgi:hypothetical protein
MGGYLTEGQRCVIMEVEGKNKAKETKMTDPIVAANRNSNGSAITLTESLVMRHLQTKKLEAKGSKLNAKQAELVETLEAKRQARLAIKS